jgi:hypothetical protein
MQTVHFRTPAFAPNDTVRVPRESRMAGTIVEYARFVEVQERRARMVAELERPPQTPAPPTESTVDQFIDVGGSVTSVEASTTPRTIDVR